MGQSIIKKISLEIDKNKERRHVIIANKNISKRWKRKWSIEIGFEFC